MRQRASCSGLLTTCASGLIRDFHLCHLSSSIRARPAAAGAVSIVTESAPFQRCRCCATGPAWDWNCRDLQERETPSKTFSPSEVRPAEVRSGEVHPGEVRQAEVRLGEVRPVEVRPVIGFPECCAMPLAPYDTGSVLA